MSALVGPRMGINKVLSGNISLPLAASTKAWNDGVACMDTAAYVVKPGAAGNANLVPIGEFFGSVDNSAASTTSQVLVTLPKELSCDWYDNASGGAAVVNLFTTAYILDDHTVTNSSSGNSAAGRVFQLDPIKGVLILKPWGA